MAYHAVLVGLNCFGRQYTGSAPPRIWLALRKLFLERLVPSAKERQSLSLWRNEPPDTIRAVLVFKTAGRVVVNAADLGAELRERIPRLAAVSAVDEHVLW